MNRLIEWCTANPEIIALVIGVALPHVRALIPAQSVPVLDALAGNYLHTRNAPPVVGSRAAPKDEQG